MTEVTWGFQGDDVIFAAAAAAAAYAANGFFNSHLEGEKDEASERIPKSMHTHKQIRCIWNHVEQWKIEN